MYPLPSFLSPLRRHLDCIPSRVLTGTAPAALWQNAVYTSKVKLEHAEADSST
jgi:hypothetical protein